MDPMIRRQADSRLGSMGMPTDPTDPAIQGQQPMTAVHYREPAEDPAMACQQCSSFLPPDACALVAGTIRPEGTCDLFSPIQAAQPGGPQAPMAPTTP